jgi:hypothetical protein
LSARPTDGYAQTDKETDDAIRRATDTASKTGAKMPDIKKQMADIEPEKARGKLPTQ